MSNSKSSNNKVKSVRLYKIGGYQASESINENKFDSKNAFKMRPPFADPRNLYFNPYMPGSAIPASYHQPFQTFQPYQPYRKSNMPQSKFHSQYYQHLQKTNSVGNNYYSWNDPRIMTMEHESDESDDENDSDDEYEETEEEEEEEPEEKEESDNDSDLNDEESDEDLGKEKKATTVSNAVSNNKSEPQQVKEVKKITFKSDDEAPSNANKSTKKNDLKENHITAEKKFPEITPNDKLQSSNLNLPEPPKAEQTRPRSSRVFPIKGTTKKVVKITSAEVIESPYIQSKPILKNKTNSFEKVPLLAQLTKEKPEKALEDTNATKEKSNNDEDSHEDSANTHTIKETSLEDENTQKEIKADKPESIQIEASITNEKIPLLAQLIEEKPEKTNTNQEKSNNQSIKSDAVTNEIEADKPEAQLNEKNVNSLVSSQILPEEKLSQYKKNQSVVEEFKKEPEPESENSTEIKPQTNLIMIPQASYEDENSLFSPKSNESTQKLDANDETEKNIVQPEKLIIGQLEHSEGLKETETKILDDDKLNLDEIFQSDLKQDSVDESNEENLVQLIKLENELQGNNFYEKNFKKPDKEIEVLSTITERSPVSNKEPEKTPISDQKDKAKRKESKSKKDLVKPKEPKVSEKFKEHSTKSNGGKLTDIYLNQELSKNSQKPIKEKETTSATEEINDDLPLNPFNQLERENSIFFGKISKMEMPMPVSTSPVSSDYDKMSDHDQRINEIIEENRGNLFGIQSFKDVNEENMNNLGVCTCSLNGEEAIQPEPEQPETNKHNNSKIVYPLTNRSKLKNKPIKKSKKIDPSQMTKRINSLSLLDRAYSDLNLKKSKTNLPSLTNLEEKTKEKSKIEPEESKNEIKFPSLIMSEKPEDFKSISNSANNYFRKYFDPKFKRCPCLMHNRLYYEEGRDFEADIEPYEMRPVSVKDPKSTFASANYFNSATDYQLIYGERYIGFFPGRLKSVNEILTNVEEEFLKTQENEDYYKASNLQKALRRGPWNNAF